VNKNWLAIALFVVSAGAAGCKQGIGERCQVGNDCSSGVCSQSVPKVCVGSNNGDQNPIDAALPADAAIDAVADAP
jgi:hypothetical protein